MQIYSHIPATCLCAETESYDTYIENTHSTNLCHEQHIENVFCRDYVPLNAKQIEKANSKAPR